MGKMFKRLLLSSLVLGALVAVSGCCASKGKNASATSYCSGNRAQDSCLACCKTRKTNGSFSGNVCSCMNP